MADTLDHQILNIVARESTHMWAHLCHQREEFTLCSQGFTALFNAPSSELSADAALLPWAAPLPIDLAPDQPTFLVQSQLEKLLLARQYQLLEDHFSPEFDLRFYSLEGDCDNTIGTLLFVESRHQINLAPDKALRTHHASRQIDTLSPRESQVMKMVVLGMTNQGIAIELGLSPKTIEKHRKKMMTKLGVHSVAEVARIAFDAELFELLLEAQLQSRHDAVESK